MTVDRLFYLFIRRDEAEKNLRGADAYGQRIFASKREEAEQEIARIMGA